MNTAVILPAAGLGKRFAVGERASASKVEFELAHKPVFLHAIDRFHGRGDVGQILLAIHPACLDAFAFRWADKLSFMGVRLIAGGEAERWQTVQLALEQVADEATHIAVHDAARPCASSAMIDRVFAAAERWGAAVPGLPMGDTVKRVSDPVEQPAPADPLDAIFDAPLEAIRETRTVLETVPRHDLYRVQTPQVFERAMLIDAYAALSADNADGVTDDASVVERAGHAVYAVQGDPLNLKLTHPDDAELIEAIFRLRLEKQAQTDAVKQLFGDDDDE
ncbi:MAG: 2-C-methyl-D-erythritol 4-phosphate cytidylyltransferase [Phycisphaeraceae bacterium]